MDAIACILSYDGLPGNLATKHGSGQSSADASGSAEGRKGGFIPPGGFLMSLLSDIPPNAPHHQKSSNHPGGGSGHIRSSRAPAGRFNQSQQRPGRNSSGPGSSASQSFKRQRDAAR